MRDLNRAEGNEMRTWLFLVLAALALLFVATAAANASSIYFAQDNFNLTFASPNDPAMPGSTFLATGELIGWNTNITGGYFSITGTGLAGSVVGSEYVTPYSASMNIYSDAARTTLVWTGTGGSLETRVMLGAADPFNPTDAESYVGANYSRPILPTPITIPSYFQSVGDGVFMGSGTWDPATTLYMPWFGTYNWHYTANGQGQYIIQTGNVQGELTTAVPEPGTILLLGFGLSALGLAARFRNR